MRSLQANTAVDIDRPLFRAFPPVVSFRGYQIGSTVEATLCLRNEDQASLQLCSVHLTPYLWLDEQQKMPQIDPSLLSTQANIVPAQLVASGQRL